MGYIKLKLVSARSLKQPYSSVLMSLTHFFYEPLYSASDLERIANETVTARNCGNRQIGRETVGNRSLKPRYDNDMFSFCDSAFLTS